MNGKSTSVVVTEFFLIPGRIQNELREKLVIRDDFLWNLKEPSAVSSEELDVSRLRLIGGVDISFVKDDPVNACATLVVLSFPELKVQYELSKMIQLTLPYIPSFLAFREVSFHVELLNQLRQEHPELEPQVIFVDGNGVLHPRGRVNGTGFVFGGSFHDVQCRV